MGRPFTRAESMPKKITFTNPRLINALSNLRVMTKKANLEKSYRYDDANWEADFAEIKRSVYER